MSKPNPLSALANFATGGLYGTATAVASGDPNRIAGAGLSPTSPGGAVGTATGAGRGLSTKAPGIPGAANLEIGPAPTPSDPDTAAKLAAADAAERKRRRAQASLLTSPTGVLGEAPTSVKTLLGS